MSKYSGLWTLSQQSQAYGTNQWPRKPGAPTIGTATATNAQATVTFTAPTDLGVPAVITSYTATSSPGGITGTASASPITVSGLSNGTSYTFTVTATNSAGTGPASAASNSVTPTASVTFVWTKPPSNTSMTFSNGDRTATNGGSGYQTAFVALPTISGGKYYWELTTNITNQYGNMGVGNSISNNQFYQDVIDPYYVQRSSGNSFTTQTWTSSSGGSINSMTSGTQRYGFAYDVDTRKLWVRQNGGSWIGGGSPTSGTTATVTLTGTSYLVGETFNGSSESYTITDKNSQVDSVPSGFTAIGG